MDDVIDRLIDPDRFDFSFPVFICTKKTQADVVLSGALDVGGRYVPVFTSLDLAEDYVAAKGMTGITDIRPIQSDIWVQALEAFIRLGYTWIVFDDIPNATKVRQPMNINAILSQQKGSDS